VLDTETTGLSNPELVSLSIVDETGGVVMDELVRPAKLIEQGATRITGITNELVKNRPEFPSIYTRFKQAVNGRLVVIYNAAFDLQVLASSCQRYNLEMPQFEYWCAMEWFAKVYGKWDTSKQDFKWQKLSVAAKYFAVDQYNSHNALSDCLTTLKVIEAGLAKARQQDSHMDFLL
jgi:DNA polymerase-3 subunit epsilon